MNATCKISQTSRSLLNILASANCGHIASPAPYDVPFSHTTYVTNSWQQIVQLL